MNTVVQRTCGQAPTSNGLETESTGTFEVLNPSTGELLGSCPDASPEQVDRVVEAARRAQRGWESLSWEQRGTLLKRYAAEIRRNANSLARLLTQEQGKPLAESKLEIARAADNLDGYAAQRVDSQILRNNDAEYIVENYHAAGVAAVISPWNAPVNLFVVRSAPYLQSGSVVIAKPSPYTPLTTLALGEIARGIFPEGVLSVLTGRDPLGQWLTEHPGIDRISFTGSISTGKKVMASSAGTLKRIGLELGGNDAAIVLDDADVEWATPRIVAAALRNAGQICMAIKRVYVADNLYEKMVEALGSQVRALKTGNGLEEDANIGPLQNDMQYQRVKKILEETRAIPGIRIVAGGKEIDRPGYFIAPTVVADIPDSARLVQEEQFGPVIPVLRYSNIDDAIRRANDTPYGLGASVWSSDPQRALSVADKLQAGSIWINSHMVLDVDVPFGGWRESGMGRGNGLAGLQSCMEAKVVRLPKSTMPNKQ